STAVFPLESGQRVPPPCLLRSAAPPACPEWQAAKCCFSIPAGSLNSPSQNSADLAQHPVNFRIEGRPLLLIPLNQIHRSQDFFFLMWIAALVKIVAKLLCQLLCGELLR